MKEEGDLWQTLFCVCLYLHALEAMLASCRPSNTARIFFWANSPYRRGQEGPMKQIDFDLAFLLSSWKPNGNEESSQCHSVSSSSEVQTLDPVGLGRS